MKKRHPGVQREYRDIDGYWIDLKPGWCCREGAGRVHGIVENTRREARAKLAEVESCECDECKKELAAV